LPSRVIASVANYFTPMKTKITSIALLVLAGLFTSTTIARAYTTYGNTLVNGYLTYNLSPGQDLTGANMFQIPGLNLTGANLFGTNLTSATLSDVNLTNAGLLYADLSNTYLFGTNLTGADLTGATLTGARLNGANLTGATVSYANWTDFSTNSGATGLDNYSYNTSSLKYANAPAVPEPSTYGLIGIAALGLAFAARRRKSKTA